MAFWLACFTGGLAWFVGFLDCSRVWISGAFAVLAFLDCLFCLNDDGRLGSAYYQYPVISSCLIYSLFQHINVPPEIVIFVVYLL